MKRLCISYVCYVRYDVKLKPLFDVKLKPLFDVKLKYCLILSSNQNVFYANTV